MKRFMFIGHKEGDVGIKYAHDIKESIAVKFERNPLATSLADLDDHNVMVLQHRWGVSAGLKPNDNLSPYFFVGSCYIVDKDFNGMTDDQIAFVQEWLKGLQDIWC